MRISSIKIISIAIALFPMLTFGCAQSGHTICVGNQVYGKSHGAPIIVRECPCLIFDCQVNQVKLHAGMAQYNEIHDAH